MRYLRIENGYVVEVIEVDEDINTLFHPDIIKTLVQDDKAVIGDEFKDNKFIKPSIDEFEYRNTMAISPADARLRLASMGKLLGIIEYINTLKDDNPLKIKWEYATTFQRLDPILIEFCTNVLAMTDLEIDALFG